MTTDPDARLAAVAAMVARFSDLAVELEKHSNDHIHDADLLGRQAAIEGVCADRINAILKSYREHLGGDLSQPTPNEAQRRSFAYGNAAIENPNVTREMVDQEADKMAANSQPMPTKEVIHHDIGTVSGGQAVTGGTHPVEQHADVDSLIETAISVGFEWGVVRRLPLPTAAVVRERHRKESGK